MNHNRFTNIHTINQTNTWVGVSGGGGSPPALPGSLLNRCEAEYSE